MGTNNSSTAIISSVKNRAKPYRSKFLLFISKNQLLLFDFDNYLQNIAICNYIIYGLFYAVTQIHWVDIKLLGVNATFNLVKRKKTV